MPLATPRWGSLMSEAPDQSTTEPKKHKSEEVGPHRDGVIILATDPSRSHLRYALPIPKYVEAITNVDAVPNLGLFLDSLKWFQPLALNWMKSLPSVSRIAFGVELLWQVDNREEGYKLLDKLLPVVEVDPVSQDLEYRINRPRVLKIENETLVANRVSTWAVKRFELEQSHGSLGTVNRGFYAVHAELDINTAADRKAALPQGQLKELLGTLFDFAVEMAEQGDVP